MATDLGKVSITLEGDYNGSIVYNRLDQVVFDGSSYTSIVDNNIQPLTNVSAWQLSSSKGGIGPKGEKGDTGYKTIDPYILAPGDPNPTVVGWYKPSVSSPTPGTNYPNAGNLKAISGMETLFYFNGTTWSKSESAIQVTQNIVHFSSASFPLVQGSQVTYDESIWEVRPGQVATASDIPSVTSTIWFLSNKDVVARQILSDNSIPVYSYTEFYNPATALSGFYNASGVFTANVDFRATPKINVTAGEVWRYRGKSYSSLSIRAVYGYKANGTIVILVNVVNAIDFIEFTIPADIVQIAASYYTIGATNFNLQKRNTNYVLVSIVKDPLNNVISINNNDISRTKTGLSIASVGDSITANGAVGTPLKGYQWYLKDYYDFTTYTSYGYSGRALSTFITPNGQSIIEQFITTAVSHDIFTLLAGTNDFRLNLRNGEIGTIEDYKNLTAYSVSGNIVTMNFYQALKAFVLRCYELNPKAKIIFMTPLQRDQDGYTSWSPNPGGKTLSDYVNAIREVAAYESIPVVDFFKEGVINMRNITQYTSDGLHPNNDGYKIMSRQIQPVIKRFL